MKNIIITLLGLGVVLAPLANATTYSYTELDIDLGNGGHVDSLYTQYNTSTTTLTFEVDNVVRNGDLMDGLWLVTNDGPENPVGEDGLAIFYADFNTNSLWAFAYNGLTDPSSYSVSPYLGNYSSGIFSSGTTFGFTVNVAPIYANLITDSPYGEQIGIWFHPTWGTVTQTDGNGRLIDLNGTGDGWYDVPGMDTTVIPIPGALLLYGSALFGLGLVRRTNSK